MTIQVSAVIVNFNSGAFLAHCLGALKGSSSLHTEVIIVDNDSRDGSLERALSTHDADKVIRNSSNRGPGPARNQGAAEANGDVILFLDPDVALPPGGADSMVMALAEHPGVVAPALYSQAHDRVEYGGTIDLFGHPIPLVAPGPVIYASASAFVTPRDFFERIKGFDERFAWGEELDYCWRVLLAGGEVTVLTNAVADHACGVSAAGGYHRGGRLETTAFRLINRERAHFAAILKCAPASRLWWTIPAMGVYTFGMAAGAACLRRPDIARGLLAGLIWNSRELRHTLGQRRQIPRSPETERRAASRIRNHAYAVRLMIDHGLPRFVDEAPSTQSDAGPAA